jgi:hypothetical protein
MPPLAAWHAVLVRDVTCAGDASAASRAGENKARAEEQLLGTQQQYSDEDSAPGFDDDLPLPGDDAPPATAPSVPPHPDDGLHPWAHSDAGVPSGAATAHGSESDSDGGGGRGGGSSAASLSSRRIAGTEHEREQQYEALRQQHSQRGKTVARRGGPGSDGGRGTPSSMGRRGGRRARRRGGKMSPLPRVATLRSSPEPALEPPARMRTPTADEAEIFNRLYEVRLV